MAFYILQDLMRDFDYVVSHYDEIKENDIDYIKNNDLSIRGGSV